MGIALATARVLLDWFGKYDISGRSLTLGVQDILFSELQLYQAMLEHNEAKYRGKIKKEGNAVVLTSKDILMTREELIARSKLYQETPPPSMENPSAEMRLSEPAFFELLGFEHQSLDNSGYEGADIIHDLNKEFLSEKKYDIILDMGTSEHVFDFPAVLRNIHNNLNEGGYICHFSPSHNFVDHGYYTFSPCLFYEFYTANHYKILESFFVRMELVKTDIPHMMQQYTPELFEFGIELAGTYDDKCYGSFFLVQKTENSTVDVIPQQGRYQREWNSADKMHSEA